MNMNQEKRESIVASALEQWIEEGGAFPVIEINSYLHHDCFEKNSQAINYLIDVYFDILSDTDKERLQQEFLYHFVENNAAVE